MAVKVNEKPGKAQKPTVIVTSLPELKYPDADRWQDTLHNPCANEVEHHGLSMVEKVLTKYFTV